MRGRSGAVVLGQEGILQTAQCPMLDSMFNDLQGVRVQVRPSERVILARGKGWTWAAPNAKQSPGKGGQGTYFTGHLDATKSLNITLPCSPPPRFWGWPWWLLCVTFPSEPSLLRGQPGSAPRVAASGRLKEQAQPAAQREMLYFFWIRRFGRFSEPG